VPIPSTWDCRLSARYIHSARLPCRGGTWGAARGHRSRDRASHAGKLPAARTLTVPARLPTPWSMPHEPATPVHATC